MRSSCSYPLVFASAVAIAACSRPEPPTITPLSGKVTGIGPAGIDVEAELEAYNPNGFDIHVKSFTASVTLDHQYNIGNVSLAHAVTLPGKQKKVFLVPISVKWSDAATLAPLALSSRDVPFEADGKVKVTAESLDVDLPFKVSGVVTHQQIVQAVGRSLPRLPF